VRFATLAADEDVAALARRLYRPTTPEAQREAERALLEANPQLAESAARTPGTIVVVPDLPGLSPTAEVRGEGELVAPILQAARDRLGEVTETLRATLDSRRASVKATVDQIGSADFKRLLREEPALKDVFADVAAQAKAETAEVEALDKLAQQAVGELGQDLDALIKAFGGTPRPEEPARPPVTRRPRR
jgi:hypothetical protein